MPIKNGTQYIESLNRLKPNVWFQGEAITEALSEHSALRGLIATQAAMYDMQGHPEYRDRMTYPSPLTGEPVGLSFLQPKTREDLEKRRIMMSLWAHQHHGFLGRSPDYMNTGLMAYYSAADVLSELEPEYADNLKQYYVYCREHDVTLSHAFIQPAASRVSILQDSIEKTIGAKVHESNDQGIVVSGAFLLATQGVTSDEILISPPPVPSYEGGLNPYTFAFAVPINLPGIQFVCRESFVRSDSPYDHPLSSRFEEMDTLVIFDHVLVPRNRIFLYGDYDVAERFYRECHFHTHVSHQVLCRYIAKTEFFLGLVQCLQKLNGSSMPSSALYEQVTELVTVLEILKSFLVNAEVHPARDRWGNVMPNQNTMLVANSYFPKVYPRMLEIVQTLGSSKIIMIPSERDLQSTCGFYLDKFLKLQDMSANEAISVHRLAWELSASSFAGRQVQFERFFFGGPSMVMDRLYDGYSNKEVYMDRIIQFLRIHVPEVPTNPQNRFSL